MASSTSRTASSRTGRVRSGGGATRPGRCVSCTPTLRACHHAGGIRLVQIDEALAPFPHERSHTVLREVVKLVLLLESAALLVAMRYVAELLLERHQER